MSSTPRVRFPLGIETIDPSTLTKSGDELYQTPIEDYDTSAAVRRSCA